MPAKMKKYDKVFSITTFLCRTICTQPTPHPLPPGVTGSRDLQSPE